MTTYTENNVNYDLGKGLTVVVASPNATGNIEIKSSITLNSVAYPVRNILADAFTNNNNITGVIIPSTIMYIGNGAFQGCTQLSKVYFKGLPETENDSFSEIRAPGKGGALLNTAYIKNMYNPNGMYDPTISRLDNYFNIEYLESSVMDAFSFTAAPPPPPTIPAAPTITNIRSTGGVTSISFQNPANSSITNYAYSTINVVDIENSVLPPFSSYTLLSPAQTTSPLNINGLHGVVQIKIKAFNGSYSNESTSFKNWYQPPFV